MMTIDGGLAVPTLLCSLVDIHCAERLGTGIGLQSVLVDIRSIVLRERAVSAHDMQSFITLSVTTTTTDSSEAKSSVSISLCTVAHIYMHYSDMIAEWQPQN